MLPEYDTYGLKKRFNFVCECIDKIQPNTILDYGCGAGTYLTVPLSIKYPDIKFVGADLDSGSIQFANENNTGINNLEFVTTESLTTFNKFKLVIASEVLEHVNDPVIFMEMLKSMLDDNGNLILTVPNGYGPFEWASLFESILYLSGVSKIIMFLKHNKYSSDSTSNLHDTLAVSPHINFFSYSEIYKLFDGAGMNVVLFLPRTFLCGFGFDKIIKSEKLLKWNEKVSEVISPYLVSDWMFQLKKTKKNKTYIYNKNLYGKLRTVLNNKRVHL